MASKATNVRFLNLSLCKWTTDSSLALFFEKNKHLTYVNLNFCTSLTVACLQPLIIKCKVLYLLFVRNKN
jgi:hypothetical protein